MEEVGWPEPAAVEARMLSAHSCAASSFHSCTLSMSSPPGSSARTRAYEATLPGPTNQHRSGWSRRFVPSSGPPPSLVQPRKEPRRGVRIGGKPGGGWGAGLEPPAGGTGVRPDRTSAGRRLSPTGHPPLDVGAGPVPVGPFPGFVAGGGGAIAVLVAAVASGPLFLSSAQNAAL